METDDPCSGDPRFQRASGSRHTQARTGELPHPSNQLFTRFPNLFTAVIQSSRRHVWKQKMQDYREIDRIRKDVVAVRSLASTGSPSPRAPSSAGALDGMSSSDPCIYPTEKRSYLLESSLPEMLRSGSSRFLIRARAVHDNLHVTGISLQGRIDIRWMR